MSNDLLSDLQRRREALGLSKVALAGLAHVSWYTIHRIEKRRGVPQRSTVKAIRDALKSAERQRAAQ